MLENNSVVRFQEELVRYGGTIMWKNTFSSWTKEEQLEMIAYIHGFIIYAQTDLGFMQPPWIAFEHNFSYDIKKFASIANKYYIKTRGVYTHTVFQIYPKNVFLFLEDISEMVEVHSEFREIPHYKLFHFLNRAEVAKYYGNEEKTMEIVLNKMKAANLSTYIPTVMFLPEPKYYEI